MRIDDLPDQFEAFLDRARAVLSRENARAREAVKAANAETAKAKIELTQLQGQLAQAQSQLNTTLNDLRRAQGLAALDREIAEARKTNEGLKAKTKALELSNAAKGKQITEAEHRLTALQSEAQRCMAVRSETEAYVSNIKMQLNSVQIGRQT
jgi:chromosome segregation ATPase